MSTQGASKSANGKNKMTRKEIISGLENNVVGLSYIWNDKNDMPQCNWTHKRPTVNMLLRLQHEGSVVYDGKNDIFIGRKK